MIDEYHEIKNVLKLSKHKFKVLSLKCLFAQGSFKILHVFAKVLKIAIKIISRNSYLECD